MPWNALAAVVIAGAVSFFELLNRYRDSGFMALGCWMFWTIIGVNCLLAGIFAGLLSAAGAGSGTAGEIILQIALADAAALSVARAGTVGPRLRLASSATDTVLVTSEPAAKDTGATVLRAEAGIRLLILRALLDYADKEVRNGYQSRLDAEAKELRSIAPEWTSRKQGQRLWQMCAQLRALSPDEQKDFQESYDLISRSDLNDRSKRLLLLRQCIHHCGRETTLHALEEVLSFESKQSPGHS